MTEQREVIGNPLYIPVHNAGFVGLVDVMGDDSAICQAARVSYGKGTKSTADDRALIRYMMRHRHTSPFEMVEFKFHIKLPIFVMRQHIRHRTASVNEYSGRYSEMSNEFYFPEDTYLMRQATTNKQGRAGAIGAEESGVIKTLMTHVYDAAYRGYMHFLEKHNLARELSRLVLPVANYTECYWKIDLKNLLHYFGLRRDSHAQAEIRDFANAMFELVKDRIPLAIEAWEDYAFNSYTLSAMELKALRDVLDVMQPEQARPILFDKSISDNEYGMSKREMTDFLTKFFPALLNDSKD